MGREMFIRSVLRRLAKQRVAAILQPGNVWVIEKAVIEDDHVDEALRTCHLRGWVEVLDNAVAAGTLKPDGSLPEECSMHIKPMYRLTDSGWGVIHGTHAWIVATWVTAFATLIASVMGVYISTLLMQ
jgi:hypothetical protein